MTTDDTAAGPRIKAAGERSIAAQRIGNAYSGDVHVLPAEALQAPDKVTAAPGTSNLPPATLCLGRDEELNQLRRILTGGGEGAVTQSGAVHGLGGIGKSTLALRYAHRHRGDYSLIWWINAASPDAIETSLTELTKALVPDWAASAGRGAQVSWARQWLAWHRGWLLIYDNVEDPADLAPYTGALHQGHHLATSRRTTGWPDTAATLCLGNLDPDDATTLLCHLVFKDTPPTPQQQVHARALVADLGCLPLAVKQAGAYLAQNRGVSLDAYQRRLGTKLDRTAHGIDAERTIARVWNVTLQTLEGEHPLAVDVLHTAAWLAPDDIPHTLLTPSDADPDDIAEGIGTLAAYSMVTDTGTTLSVHRLVQTVLCRPLYAGEHQHWQGRERAEQAVLHAIARISQEGTNTEPQRDALTSHLVALAATTPPGYHHSELTDAYNSAADRLYQLGHPDRAAPLLEAVLAQQEQALGAMHPDTLTTRHNLSVAYRVAGDLGRAISLAASTLALREQLLGDTHPETLTARHSLAYAYRHAGDLEQAISLAASTLALREQLLGDTHPETLTSRHLIATIYRMRGDLRRAIPLLESVLAQRERVQGDTHDQTLTTRNDLAEAYRDAGKLEQAISLLEATVAQHEEVLGDTHPSTLTIRHNLAIVYRDAGDLKQAIPLLESVLAQRERVQGDTHRSTLTTRNTLASVYREAGVPERAIPLLEAVLAQRERVQDDTGGEVQQLNDRSCTTDSGSS